MRVHAQGPNLESLKRELYKLKTPEERIEWVLISTVRNYYICSITDPTQEEEYAMLYYGELR